VKAVVSELLPFFLAFSVSCVVSLLAVSTARWHVRWSADPPNSGPQKLHTTLIPRIGGIALSLGFFAALIDSKLVLVNSEQIVSPYWLVAALAVPLVAGLYEDITQSFGPVYRLLATFIAAAIAFFLCGVKVVRFEMPLLDLMLASTSFAPLIFTMFCVGGVAHAFNLADGLNGLLAGITLIASVLITFLAREQSDVHVYVCALALAGTCVGFLCFNFPRARLFAGDSGAYFLGTAVAFLAILLVARNQSVSPWFAFVAVLYPFTDTSFAIARRLFQRRPIMQPDAEHLHSLLANRIRASGVFHSNSVASTIILVALAFFALAAWVGRTNSGILVTLCAVFAALYSLAWITLAKRSQSIEPSQLQGLHQADIDS
jgi:UDP-GlcNAc:undecaprenyl-phosphate/decaprenyl-phosphate GlcNAc-1-phosphate transferase